MAQSDTLFVLEDERTMKNKKNDCSGTYLIKNN